MTRIAQVLVNLFGFCVSAVGCWVVLTMALNTLFAVSTGDAQAWLPASKLLAFLIALPAAALAVLDRE